MKLSIDQKTLSAALKQVARVAAVRSTLPTIQGIFLDASFEHGLKLRATNLTIMETITLEAEVEEEGKTVAPRMFVDLVETMKGDVQLELSKFQLSVNAGKSKSKLNCYDPEDFPQVASPDKWLQVSVRDFLAGIARTLFSVNETEYLATSGVHVELDGNFMNFHSTDSLGRISMAKFPLVSEVASYILPKDSCKELLKVLQGEVAEVAFGPTLSVRCGNVELSTQVMEDKFPDVARMVQSEFALVATSFKEDWLDALRQVSVLGSSFITLTFSGNSLSFRSVSQELGNSEAEIEVENTGKDATINLNPKYLKDAIDAVPTSKFHFKQSPSTFVTIAPLEGDSCLFLIAPMNVK